MKCEDCGIDSKDFAEDIPMLDMCGKKVCGSCFSKGMAKERFEVGEIPREPVRIPF